MYMYNLGTIIYSNIYIYTHIRINTYIHLREIYKKIISIYVYRYTDAQVYIFKRCVTDSGHWEAPQKSEWFWPQRD